MPYHFLFGRRTFGFRPTTTKSADIDPGLVQPETRQRVLDMLAERLQRPLRENEQRPEVRLDQLGLDSLGRMELSLQVERSFGFTSDEAAETIGQLLALAEGRAQRKPPRPPPPGWAPLPTEAAAAGRAWRHGPGRAHAVTEEHP